MLLLYLFTSLFPRYKKKNVNRYEDALSADHHFLSELVYVKVFFRALMVKVTQEGVPLLAIRSKIYKAVSN